jgi:D-alanine-D-alanine ligase
MKVCVLQPDYSTSGVDYQNYDPPRDLSRLLPGDQVHHISLNKLTTYKQLRDLSKQSFDVFVNLCEGYLEWEIPSIDVIHTLELLDLPFTGPTSKLYDPTKELMKYVAYCVGVNTPGYVRIERSEDVQSAAQLLNFPLFVKPAKAGDSLGIDEHSKVADAAELSKKVNEILEEYGPLLVEEYIDGREFTVLVAANPDGKTCTAFKPVEYIFPTGRSFKTYALKTSELHPDANIPCNDPVLEKKLKDAAEKIFLGFQGVGYARLDFRVDTSGSIYFLEINFTCSVFYQDGYEGSADFILKFDGIGQAGFLKHMIDEGIARHQRKKKCYEMRGNSIAGYGIYAKRNLAKGEVIFKGEGRAQRIITRRHVEKYWNEEEKLNFRRYAYPISEEVFILWDEEPAEWAPQNHSCEANTAFDGLDVRAQRDITAGEELTLDYAHFLDHNMEPFDCQCGSSICKKLIRGPEANTLNLREQTLRG